MLAALAALTLAVAAHAAPAVPAFEQSLLQIRSTVLAASARMITQEQLKKVDGNVALTDNQAAQLRSRLASLRAQARTQPSDPSIGGQLYALTSDLNVYAQNCEVVRKQALDLAATTTPDPALVALAKKLYDHSRYLDSDAGYLALDGRTAYSELGAEGFGSQGYQIMTLADKGASFTPDTRVAAKSVLDKIQ